MSLPEGWISKVSSSTGEYVRKFSRLSLNYWILGKTYYVNTETQESQWEFPQHPAAANTTKVRCLHLLVKHSGSRRPSSWKESNITRTKDEALEIINSRFLSGVLNLPMYYAFLNSQLPISSVQLLKARGLCCYRVSFPLVYRSLRLWHSKTLYRYQIIPCYLPRYVTVFLIYITDTEPNGVWFSALILDSCFSKFAVNEIFFSAYASQLGFRFIYRVAES